MQSIEPIRRRTALLLAVLLPLVSTQPNFAERREEESGKLSEVGVLEMEAWEMDGASGSEEPSSEELRIIVLLEAETALDEAMRRGLPLSEMPENVLRSASQRTENRQEELRRRIAEEEIPIRYICKYSRVLSGFSAVVPVKDAEKIAGMPGVVLLRESRKFQKPRPLPMTSSSLGMIGADILQGCGYTGEGKLIAILDSGIDPSDGAFRLDEGAKTRLDRAAVEAAGLPGEYKSEKIPYAYDYADQDEETAERGSGSHGMHVAGIAAANSKEKGGIVGVAPNAQLLAMKVFSDFSGAASEDSLIRAIDDALILGADVINLSLGTDAAMEVDEIYDPLKLAVRRAEEAGVPVVAAAGNANHYGSPKEDLYPRAEQPDYGVISSPALYEEIFAAAAVENLRINGLDGIRVQEGQESFVIPYQLSGTLPLTTGSVFALEDCGLGRLQDLEGKDLKGKAALIERGEIFFSEKVANVRSKGASAALIFNHEAGGDRFFRMAGLENAGIPAVSILRSDGLRLRGKEGLLLHIREGEKTDIPNPVGGQTADFSSWGASPELRLKPDLAAPGGNIESLDNGATQRMSGTSMAAPHIAAATILLSQAREQELGQDRARIIRNILMSTAVPLRGEEGVLKSPRKQGAGLLDLAAALNTPAYLEAQGTGRAKVELGDQLSRGSFVLELVNFSKDQTAVYEVGVEATADSVLQGSLRPDQPLSVTEELGLSYPSLVTVAPGQRLSIRISYDASELLAARRDAFPSGFFVEGFVFLRDRDELAPQPELSLPFMGFCGDWNKPRILDYSNYEREIGRPFYGNFTRLYTKVKYGEGERAKEEDLGSSYDGKSYDSDRIAISPNGDESGDQAFFAATFLRNARRMEIEIEDTEAKVIARPYKLSPTRYITKNFYDGDKQKLQFYAHKSWNWDGKDLSGALVKDGNYFFIVRLKRSDEEEAQTMRLPIRVDTRPPQILSCLEEEGKVLLTARDEGAGIREYRLIQEGRIFSSEDGIFEEVDLSRDRSYLVIDHARNIARLDRSGQGKLAYETNGGGGSGGEDSEGEREFPEREEREKEERKEEKSPVREKQKPKKEMPARIFYDVDSDHPAKEAIDALVQRGYFSGYADGSFRPDRPVSRAEAAMVLMKVLELKRGGEEVSFHDVAAGDWYAEPVKVLSSLGILSGFPDGTFRPQQRISREQMSLILVRAVEKSGDRLERRVQSFSDQESIAGWARDAVELAVSAGLISGFEDGSFRPKAPVSRAEFAVLLWNRMKRENMVSEQP